MARKVKCKICKSRGDTDTFYKVYENSKNSYYCSKQEYDSHVLEKIKRHDLLEYVAVEVLGYDEGQIVPPSMVKKIGQMNKFYDYDVIHETFKQNKDNIQYWIRTKDFSSEFGMVSYVMKIIEGNVNDIYKQWKYKKQQNVKVENTSVDLNILNQLDEYKNNKQESSGSGILSFLDEEDI